MILERPWTEIIVWKAMAGIHYALTVSDIAFHRFEHEIDVLFPLGGRVFCAKLRMICLSVYLNEKLSNLV